MAGNQKPTFGDRIEKACRGLVYISETDSEVEPFRGAKTDGTGPEEFRRSAEIGAEPEIESGDVEDLIERLSQERDWHSKRDEQNANGFKELFSILKKELKDLRLYRVGRIQVEIYVVGIDRKGRMRGVKMRAVET